MKLFLMGAGRVAQTLAHALYSKHCELLGIWCRSAEKAKQLQLPSEVFLGELPHKLSEADVVIVCVSDRAVPSVVTRAAALLRPDAVILHTAGSLPPIHGLAVESGSMHPLQSIVSARESAEKLVGSFFAISGSAKAVSVATALVQLLGGRAVEVRDPVRYHAAAVLASNSIYPLVALSLSLLAQAGVSAELGTEMLVPLLRGSIENIATLGPSQGMTGPVARADAATIARHLEALQHEPLTKALYVALAEAALPLAEAAGADPKRLAEVETLLASAGDFSAH